MSELRQNPTTKEWVIVATERARRPHEFVRAKAGSVELPDYSPTCPFCPGNEHLTPPVLLTYPPAVDKADHRWGVRAFPNKYAALSLPGKMERRQPGPLFRQMDGVGAHEVIVETPYHNRSLGLMTDAEVELVLRAYQERYRALRNEPWAKFIIIFKNHGTSAGTSLEHPHSQLVATPIAPIHIRQKHEVAESYYDDTGRCIYCDLAQEELAAQERVVLTTDHFVVFEPFASQTPFETWIAPRRHLTSFGDMPPEELRGLAQVLRQTLAKLHKGLGDPDYNYIISPAPEEDEHKSYYLWHIQILPRLTTAAGFELGSGIYITTAKPEETAAFLREIEA